MHKEYASVQLAIEVYREHLLFIYPMISIKILKFRSDIQDLVSLIRDTVPPDKQNSSRVFKWYPTPKIMGMKTEPATKPNFVTLTMSISYLTKWNDLDLKRITEKYTFNPISELLDMAKRIHMHGMPVECEDSYDLQYRLWRV